MVSNSFAVTILKYAQELEHKVTELENDIVELKKRVPEKHEIVIPHMGDRELDLKE